MAAGGGRREADDEPPDMSRMRFEPAKGPAALHAVLIVIDPETGRATDIRRLRVPA